MSRSHEARLQKAANIYKRIIYWDATAMLKILGVVFLFSLVVATAHAGTTTLVYERCFLAATAASTVYFASHEMPRNDSGVYY